MSDTTAPVEPQAAPPTAEPPTASDPPPDAGGAPPPEPPPWEGKTPEELWTHSDKLHKENVAYKERFRPFEEALGWFHDDDRQFILNVFNGLRSDNPEARAEAAAAMRQAMDVMSPAQKAAVADAVEQDPEFDPYNPENIDKRAAQIVEQRLAEESKKREQADVQRQALERLSSKARSIAESSGVADFGDPSTVLGRMLVLSATNDFPDEPSMDAKLERAAERIQQDLAERSQELLQRKTAAAGPSPVPAAAAEPSGVTKPKTFADASKSAEDRIEAALRGPG